MDVDSPEHEELLTTARALGREAHDRGARRTSSHDKAFSELTHKTLPAVQSVFPQGNFFDLFGSARRAWILGWDEGRAALPHCKCCGQLLPR